jgi:hypothetical protein
LADRLRGDPEEFTRLKNEASERLATIPPMAKGVRSEKIPWQTWLGAGLALGAVSLLIYRMQASKKK